MHPYLRYLSLAANPLLVLVTSPLSPLTSHLSFLQAQAQTIQDRNAEAKRLYQEGVQQYNRGQFREALQTFQQNAALLYPLILQDRLELVVVTDDFLPIHRTTSLRRIQESEYRNQNTFKRGLGLRSNVRCLQAGASNPHNIYPAEPDSSEFWLLPSEFFPVKLEGLNRAIAKFHTALENSNSDVKTPARQLYERIPSILP